MQDVRRIYSIGLPVVSMLVFVIAAIISPAFYRAHVRRHEIGWQEQGTIICLVPAVVIGVAILLRSRELKRWWVRAWVVILTCGALYFAGEECSWGQNYIGWSTPERWSQINDQHETNLHNTSGLFDHVPRALLSLAAGCCVVMPLVLRRLQRDWLMRQHPMTWLLPTSAVVPAAALATLSDIPQKFYGQYDKTHEAANWFAEMFLAGRHSEMKEYFLAMFILMYMWSFATRFRNVQRQEAAKPPCEPARLAA
jgi:uncharacterized membrane protein YgdD (TMEM256/DUF423 family)